MQKLHLLGFTNDLDGVVFAQRRGSKKAAYWVAVDDAFVRAVEKLESARRQRRLTDPNAQPASERRPPQPPPPRPVLPAIGRSESQIPASEIQQLLREGRSVETVMKVAKAPREWVERLAEPVAAERDGVVRLAQRAYMPRPRLGRSGAPLGQAIRMNLEERRATMATLEAIDEGWDARATPAGPWRVRLRFSHRGSRRVAEWDFVKSTGAIAPRNRLAAELGWWPAPEAPRPPKPPPEPEPETAEEPEDGDSKSRKPASGKRSPKTNTRRTKARSKAGKRARPPTGRGRRTAGGRSTARGRRTRRR